jgi:energy-coupling factor transporter ATP-binding protein EcfA2
MAGLEIGTTKAVASAAIALINKAHKQGWFNKLVTALRKKQRVLVLGATGTGKTAFLESLNDVVQKAIHQMKRTEFAQKYSVRIAKEPFLFTDAPGQIVHAARRKAAIQKSSKRRVGLPV